MIKTTLIVVLTAMIMASCSHHYYIVRHAEKEDASSATTTGNDPALSEAGKVRAIVLRDELKKKHIRSIYTTNTQRARSTAQPLSEATGVAIQAYSSTDSLISQLKNVKQGSVLVVGHSNTVDDIVNKLCGETKVEKDLTDSQYDNLFIVTYKGKKITFTRHKYGYPSNPE